MKKILVISALLFAFSANAFEIGLGFDLSNMAFDQERALTTTSLYDDILNWGIEGYFTHQIEENVGVDFIYDYDPATRNTFKVNFHYAFNYFKVGIGPSLGFLNTSSYEYVKPGLLTSIYFSIPGFIFAEYYSEGTRDFISTGIEGLSNVISENGDFLQNTTKLSGGFYVENAICSLTIESKTFSEIKNNNQYSHTLSKYYFSTDIFQKNTPYTLKLDFGYQTVNKYFHTENKSLTVASAYLGVSTSFTIINGLTLEAGIDNGFYTFGLDELLGESSPNYSFRLHAMLIFNSDDLM